MMMSVGGRESVGRICCLQYSTLAMESNEETRTIPLYKRLSALGKAAAESSGETVTKTLNQYVREGRVIKKYEIQNCVQQLRKYKRFHHALEVIEWMEKRGTNLSHKDFAIRIDLLLKTKGIESAEEYFKSLPATAKKVFTYGALLNCYCQNKMTEKAIALFERMCELNVVSTLAYNNLISLYLTLRQPEEVFIIVKKMKERGLLPDMFTYVFLMRSHALLKDIDGVERVLKELETEHSDMCSWTTYSNLAAIYIEASLFEKAESALVKFEKNIMPRDRSAYRYLISLYAGCSNLSEVHRVWKSLKSAFPTTTNLDYLVTLQALAKLDSFHVLLRCFEDWVSSSTSYDMRIANVMISALLRQDMVEEASNICEDSIKRGSGPNFKTQELFLDYYIRNVQWDLAFSCMEATVSKVKNNEWKPNEEKVSAFLKHFEKTKDIARAEEFCKMLKKLNCLDLKAYRLLLCTYVAAKEKEPGMRKRLESDEIEMNTEIEELLRRVS
ncbi:Pentatricopeptide repeat-containing protein [Thalictrum thalictroides]|uniref:Pentatricopeptide repeat-containing protein n=1 Tax=Thalictrum thalictroides TaxID=46969 RepID=A0A7J6VZC6_THATH|nr:Pentatricopeptide repeat-containing protein [Thalictrum thalictroides]